MKDLPESKSSLDVLVLEPYDGGSHRAFLDGLEMHCPFRIHRLSLPARKWKWRMRLSAPYFAREIQRLNRRFDRILCSTFVDVATLRGLAPRWVREVPVLTYYHENQFAYPVRQAQERDVHFSLINVTTALASDRIAFNSRYNLESFFEGLRTGLRAAYDMPLPHLEDRVRRRATVLPPGIDFLLIDATPPAETSARPRVIWNHRWEHDKDPEAFFETMFRLDSKGFDFDLVILGQHFDRGAPAVFDEARHRLTHRIAHIGFAERPAEYAAWLRTGHAVVSTARHEFFGISVIEAVRAGCRPVLPNRLSYPELFPDEPLYPSGGLEESLRKALSRSSLPPDRARMLTDRFSWKSRADAFTAWIAKAVPAADGEGSVDSLELET